MESNIINDHCSTIMQIYKQVITTYELNVDIITRTEGELNDLLHECELSSPKNAREGYQMYKQIRELRQKRRRAKDENQLLQEMYDYFKTQNGQNFKAAMQKVQSNSTKLYERQNNRTYVPRQRNDLTITDKTCQANKPFEELMQEFSQIKISSKGGKLRK